MRTKRTFLPDNHPMVKSVEKLIKFLDDNGIVLVAGTTTAGNSLESLGLSVSTDAADFEVVHATEGYVFPYLPPASPWKVARVGG